MLRENLQRNFGFILHDVARLLRTTYDRRIRELGLTRSQWWVLTHLYRKAGCGARRTPATVAPSAYFSPTRSRSPCT